MTSNQTRPFAIFRAILFLGASIALTAGCNVKRLVINSSYGLVEETMAAFFEEPDTVLAREAAPSNLKLIEGMARGVPSNPKLQTAAAQLIGAYAFGFLEDSTADEAEQARANERARALYLRGRNYAIRALSRTSDFNEMMTLDLASFERALEVFDEDDVAPLYWATFNWGLYINLSRADVGAVAELSRVAAMARRVAALDESYFYGGAHLFLMVYHGSVGTAVGGSPQMAKAEFEKAWSQSGGRFLMTKYLFAKYYCQQTLDRALFDKLLKEIAQAPNDLLPEQQLSNELAKEKAARLRARADDLF